METLKNLLKKDSNGKPLLKLIPLEKTAVNTFTKKDYDELMRVYELGNWSSGSEHSPIKINFWSVYKEKTCVGAGVNYCGEGRNRFEYSDKDFYLKESWKVLLTKEFYKKQKITSGIIKEINKYFNKN